MSFLDEDMEMIKVLDRPALFLNGRIPREAVPDGLYAYDLYESCDTGNFCYIAPLVVVNHGGTVLTKEPIDFGSADRIDLTADTSPNFLGGARTLAKDLKISVLTVTKAYTELEQEGFVKNVQGRGCFVMGRGSELMREQLICKVENGLTDAIKAARIANLPNEELHRLLDILLEANTDD